MSVFINPFTDWGFKRIFGREASKDLLIEFLNDLLVGERVITDLAFLNNERQPETQDGKAVVFDIFCRTDTGEEIVVEMQNRAEKHFKERALYYLSRTIANQPTKGKGDGYDIKAVYGVFFMNFEMAECTKLRTDVVLADRDTGEQFSDKLRQIYLALPHFTKSEAECETNFERWIYVLKNMATLKRMPFKAQMAVLKRLEEIASVRYLTKEEQWEYDRTLKMYRDNKAAEAYTDEKVQEAKAAKAELRAAKAELKAAKAEKAKLKREVKQVKQQVTQDVARNLKKLGMDTDLIVQTTGLTRGEIDEL